MDSGDFHIEEVHANSDCKASSSTARGSGVSFIAPAQPQPHQLQPRPLLPTAPSQTRPPATAPDWPSVPGSAPACLAPGQLSSKLQEPGGSPTESCRAAGSLTPARDTEKPFTSFFSLSVTALCRHTVTQSADEPQGGGGSPFASGCTSQWLSRDPNPGWSGSRAPSSLPEILEVSPQDDQGLRYCTDMNFPRTEECCPRQLSGVMEMLSTALSYSGQEPHAATDHPQRDEYN